VHAANVGHSRLTSYHALEIYRSKDKAGVLTQVHQAATDAITANTKATKEAADSETARDIALNMLSNKDAELQRVLKVCNKLQDLCRELQKHNKHVRACRPGPPTWCHVRSLFLFMLFVLIHSAGFAIIRHASDNLWHHVT
jgi:hypothetical protein